MPIEWESSSDGMQSTALLGAGHAPEYEPRIVVPAPRSPLAAITWRLRRDAMTPLPSGCSGSSSRV